MVEKAAKRKTSQACLAVLLSLVVLAAVAPVAALAIPASKDGIATVSTSIYLETRDRVSSTLTGTRDQLTSALSQDLRIGYEQFCAVEVVESLAAPGRGAELIGPRSLPSRDFPWVKYQRHVTGRNYEEMWRLGMRQKGVDARRAGFFVEAKWTGRNNAAWRSSPYNPASRFYNETKILDQARSYLELNKLTGGRGVRYGVSNEASRTHFEQLFREHFGKDIKRGVLSVWHVSGKGM